LRQRLAGQAAAALRRQRAVAAEEEQEQEALEWEEEEEEEQQGQEEAEAEQAAPAPLALAEQAAGRQRLLQRCPLSLLRPVWQSWWPWALTERLRAELSGPRRAMWRLL
jgi:hypothetical protein